MKLNQRGLLITGTNKNEKIKEEEKIWTEMNLFLKNMNYM